ncbi:MAG: hypothetical protein QXJ62_04995 [Nitrososphaeria archaeon]
MGDERAEKMRENVETIEGLNKTTEHLIRLVSNLKDVRKQPSKTSKKRFK